MPFLRHRNAGAHDAFEVVTIATPRLTEHARDLASTVVKATTRSAVTLNAGDSRSAVDIFKLNFQGFKALLVLSFAVVGNIAFVLEDLQG